MRTFTSFILAAALVNGCLGVRAADLADSLVAVVSEAPITQQGVDLYIDGDVRYVLQKYGDTQEAMKRVLALRQNGLETLITRELILHDFKENIKVPESIIEDIVQDRIKERFHGDNVELTKQLELEGITREQYKQHIRDQFIVESMRGQFVKEPIISPRKIEDYYSAHAGEFKVEDQIKMRMIVLNKSSGDSPEQVRKRAEEILSQIKGGASFEDLARTYSEGSQKAEGGETGWEDFSVLNKILAQEVTQLKPGEHSGVIDAPDGFYLLLLEDRHPASIKPLSDVREQIERFLSGQETERLARQWIERLRKKTFVQHF